MYCVPISPVIKRYNNNKKKILLCEGTNQAHIYRACKYHQDLNHYFASQEKIRQHKTIGGDAKKKYRANQLLFYM